MNNGRKKKENFMSHYIEDAETEKYFPLFPQEWHHHLNIFTEKINLKTFLYDLFVQYELERVSLDLQHLEATASQKTYQLSKHDYL